ncbi:MAG: LamG-like jellyroll fold domain-containing protein [Bacteroidota bacterium]
MKNKVIYLGALLLAVVLMSGINSCKKDTAAAAFTLKSLDAGSVDLNGAIAATTVPLKPTIVAIFYTNVDATTATNANITLTRDYDNVDIPLTITASLSSVNIVPTEALASGALYKLNIGAGLKSADGQVLTPILRTFTTLGTFAPSGAVAYWNFDDNVKDQVGTFNPSASLFITYAAGRNTAAGKAASFNGTTSIIEIPNGDVLMNTHDFTLSFWFKAANSGKGHFIIGLAAFYGFQFELSSDFKTFKMPVQFDYGDGTSGTGGDLAYNGDGKTKDNGGWKGTTFNKENTALADVLQDKWAHITYVYNSVTKERMMFLNGELVIKQDHNLWTDDAGVPTKEAGIVGLKYAGVAPETVNELAFGFIQSRAGTLWDTETWGGYDFPGANHFQGLLDDVRIYHKALTANEIDLMYKSEKP